MRPTPDIMADLLRNQPAAAIVQVSLDEIDDNPYQPRQSYDQAALEELATSIESNGLQQPPAGRRTADGRVQLVFGHRRRRAYDVLRAKDGAAWSSMPVMIVQATDEDMAARAWTENVERQDLTAVEQAQAMQRMIESFGWTQADVARRLGLAPATVANKLRLLRAPAEVQEAVATGMLSERQAGAMAPVWDLPAPALEAARNRQGYGGISNLIDLARNGHSSDALRERARQVVETQTEWLEGRPWVDVDLGHVAQVVASRCTLCQYRILSGGEARCAGPRTCYQAKSNAWEDEQRAALARATGVRALPASQHGDSFYGENKTLAEQAGLHQAPFCDYLRVKPSPYGGGLLAEGAENAELVCLHSGRGCECLERIKKQISKDGKAQWKLMRQQTVEALTAALLNPTQDTIRLWASIYAPMDKVDQVPSWRMEDVAATIIKALIDRAKPYHADTQPDKARAELEKMLVRGNITPPWSLGAVLAPEPSPLARLSGQAQMLRAGITSATSETPPAVDIERWIDDSRAALGELDRLEPGPERDDLLRDLDAANHSALEMLDLVSSGYQVSKDVAWICHTPVSDVNARTALERASADDLRWCLAVARCQPENKVRMDVIGRRLRRVGELDKADGSGGSGRPFPSTTSLRDAKRRRLHELVSGEPEQPSGYIAPTVDPNAPDNIDAKLQRIAGWIADFQDAGDGLPTPESVAGNFDNLDKLAQRIAGQPSEADKAKLQAMHATIYADLAALSDRVQASYDEEINHA